MNELFNINLPITDIAEIMNYLNVSSTELRNPARFDKFKFIAEFVKNIPNKDRFFTRLAKAGMNNVDKMDFFYEYCTHRLNLETSSKTKAFLEEQFLKTGDEQIKFELDKLDADIHEINSVIETYEA